LALERGYDLAGLKCRGAIEFPNLQECPRQQLVTSRAARIDVTLVICTVLLLFIVINVDGVFRNIKEIVLPELYRLSAGIIETRRQNIGAAIRTPQGGYGFHFSCHAFSPFWLAVCLSGNV
jgi:hypothetical protein